MSTAQNKQHEEISEKLRNLSKDQRHVLKKICVEVEQHYGTVAAIYNDLVSDWIVMAHDERGRAIEVEFDHPFRTLATGLDRDLPVILANTAENPFFHEYVKTTKVKYHFLALVSLKSCSGLRFGRLAMADLDPRPKFGLNDTDFFVEAGQRIVKVLEI